MIYSILLKSMLSYIIPDTETNIIRVFPFLVADIISSGLFIFNLDMSICE